MAGCMMVAKKDIADCAISGVKAKTYDGKKQTQDIAVKDGKTALKKGKAYKIKVKVTAKGGKYYKKGTKTATVTVKVK